MKRKSIRAVKERIGNIFLYFLAVIVIVMSSAHPSFAVQCERTIMANVVAIDQTIFLNRLGAVMPNGMIYALEKDVVINNGIATLRPDKRPRPIVLRMNVGDCLQISFKNLMNPVIGTKNASIHVNGLQLVNNISDDGSNVGANVSSLVAPGGTATYTLYAEKEGTHLLYSTAAMTGGEGNSGSIAHGLFGAVNVEPKGSEWYRSQITNAEMIMAADTNGNGFLDANEMTTQGHPIINYDAVYPVGHQFAGLLFLRCFIITRLFIQI